MKKHIEESLELLTKKEHSARTFLDLVLLGASVYTLGCVLEPEISKLILKSTGASVEYIATNIFIYSGIRKYN